MASAKRAREIFEVAQVTPPTPADLEDGLESWMLKSLWSGPDWIVATRWFDRLPDSKKRKLVGCGSRDEFLELVTAPSNPAVLYENLMANIPPKIETVIDDYKSHTIGLKKNKVGVTMFKSTPSLLLHYRDVETGKLAKEVEQSSESNGRTVIIAGASGCGKTKLLYSYFSTCPGFYLCATSQADGGSDDVTVLLDVVRKLLVLRQYSRNRLIVRLLVLLLLASRMAIYKLCQGLSHKEWLVFQAACRGLRRGGTRGELAGTYDIFADLFEALARVIPEDISEQDLQLNINVLMEFVRGCPTVAVDQAQLLFTKFDKDFFVSESLPGRQRPISNTFFEAITDALKGSKSVLLVSGTGYTLHYHTDLVATGFTKSDPSATKRYLLFGVWESSRQMVEFAETVLPRLNKRDRDYLESFVLERFRGRFRPFVTVVEQMLMGKSLVDAAHLVDTALTSEPRAAQIQGLFDSHNVRGNMYEVISGISARSALQNGVALFHLVQRAAIQYHCFGRGVTLSIDAETVIDVLEFGLGIVTVSAFDELFVEISEYLVLKAASKFFRNTHGASFFADAVLQRLGDEPYASFQRFPFQSYLPLILELMWDRYGGYIWKMPIFKPAMESLPPDAAYEDLRVQNLHATIQRGTVMVAVRSDDYQTRDFLLEDTSNKKPKRCTTLIFEERLKGGADTITKLTSSSGWDITVLRQCKLLSRPQMSQEEFRRAVETSNIVDPSLRALCGKVLIRMVDIFPAHRPAGCDWFWWKMEGELIVLVVIVDAETGKAFFGEDANVIKAVKKNAPVLEMFEAEEAEASMRRRRSMKRRRGGFRRITGWSLRTKLARAKSEAGADSGLGRRHRRGCHYSKHRDNQ